jgi:EmrB/QacA subfamily drug resistance transporter
VSSPGHPAGSRRWLSLAAICTAAAIVWFAFANLGVAIPRIADEFATDLSALQWANNAFSLVTGALVIAAGNFGDLFGRRRMLEAGIALLALFSVVAALSPNAGVLIVGRGLMGIGAALILPATLALIPPQFSGREKLTAFGAWQAVASGGQGFGPALGGIITDGLGWRWLFWVNLPLAVVAFVVIRATTPESREAGASGNVDWAGLATIGSAVFALLFALTEGPRKGWTDPLIIGLFAVALLLTIVWYHIEKRVREPLVDLRLFRLRPYDGALTGNLTMNLTFAGISYLLVLWLQAAQGYTAVQAGLLLLPSTFGIFGFIPLGNWIAARRGGRLPVLLGLSVITAGLVAVGFGVRGPLWLLAIALVVVGLGVGLICTPVSNTAVGDVPIDLAGTAAGVFKMSSMVGGALGVAILSAFTRGITVRSAESTLASSGLTEAQGSQARQTLVNSSSFGQAIETLPSGVRDRVVQAVIQAFTSGLAGTMIAAAVLTVLAIVTVALLWPPRPAGPRARRARRKPGRHCA